MRQHGYCGKLFRLGCCVPAFLNTKNLSGIMVAGETSVMNKLRDLRKANNDMTQADLANAVGVSARTVQFWEAGTVLPSFQALQSLSKVLGADVIQAFEVTQRLPRGRPKRNPPTSPDDISRSATGHGPITRKEQAKA